MRVPTPNQAKAINHVDGPAILIAGPGSGKTFTVIERIANLVSKWHVLPDSILVVTFSKAAAFEMYERYRNYPDLKEGVHFGTLHSVAYSILKESFGFNPNSLINENQKKKILLNIIKNHGLDKNITSEYASGLLDAMSKHKNSSNYLNDSFTYESDEIPQNELEKIISEYFEFLKENGYFDFDDMILGCLEKLKKNNRILNDYRKRFKYILVDEFQDINSPQYDLIRFLGEPLNNIFVVGDDDQAIYGFRGSKPGIMEQYINDYNPVKIYLSENFRSKDSIVQLAEKVISQNQIRLEKDFLPMQKGGEIRFILTDSKKDEENRVVQILKSLKEEELSKTAIILRTNREVLLFSSLLKKEGIPIKEKRKEKESFLDSIFMNDICAFLRFVFEGSKREDFLVFMNKPQKYIQRMALMKNVIKKEDVLDFYSKNQDMKVKIAAFFKKIDMAYSMTPAMATKFFRKSIGYDKYIKEISEDDNSYIRNMEIADKCEALMKNKKGAILINDFVDEERSRVASQSHLSVNSIDSIGVNLLTMHVSKGLEYNTVILPDINEGVIPPKKAEFSDLEEERRLLYVAITRAKENLFILATRERNRDISRFIKDFV